MVALRILVIPAVRALVQAVLWTGVVLVAVGFSDGWQNPWLIWAIGAGMMPFIAVCYWAYGLSEDIAPALRSVWAVWLVVVGLLFTCALISVLAGGVLPMPDPPPGLGAVWVGAGIAFAGSVWVSVCLLSLVTMWGLPRWLGVPLSIGLIVIGMVGVVAPALAWRADAGTIAPVALGSLVLTVPGLAVLLRVLPMHRLASVHRYRR